MLTKISPKAARLRTKMTYANVVSTLCLFVLVGGGTAFAVVAANQVTSRSIKNGAVQSADVKDNSLTGTDINETTLTGIQGPQGLQGPAGATGQAGATGATGPADGPAGGVLTGSYPNPGLAGASVGASQLQGDAIIQDTSSVQQAAGNYTTKVGAGAIGTSEVANGSLTGTKITDGSVGSADIAAPAAWEDMTPGTNWSFDTSNTFSHASCYKDQLGIVHLRGVLKAGAAAPNFAAALPVACRPNYGIVELVGATIGTNTVGHGFAVFYLYTDGSLTIEFQKPAQNEFLSLDGISYRPTN